MNTLVVSENNTTNISATLGTTSKTFMKLYRVTCNIKLINTIKIINTYKTSKETVLNDRQKEMLILLLKDTKFKKIISKTVLFKDKDRYIVTGEDSNGRVLFRLESYGGEFILVDSMDGVSTPNHWKLRIKNDEWKTTLEKIISLSN